MSTNRCASAVKKEQTMEPIKRGKIEAASCKIITVAEFLDLSLEEMEMVEIRLSLSKSPKQSRKQ
jgi:hypothetical protein